jgi:hypothetical protein
MIGRLTGSVIALAITAFAACASAEPISDSTRKDVSEAIERNWNVPTGVANLETYTVALRLHLSSDGVITQIDVLESKDDPSFRTLVDSARRAVLVTQSELGRLPIPANQLAATIVLRWPMKQICERYGGC